MSLLSTSYTTIGDPFATVIDPNIAFNTEIKFDCASTEAIPVTPSMATSVIPPGAHTRTIDSCIWWTAETLQGDPSWGIIAANGSHVYMDEKGRIEIKAASPVAEDKTCGAVVIESQSSTRLNVGTSLAINVNASGGHDEKGKISNSSFQNVSDIRYPAFSIHVSNGGLDIECNDGDINFTGRNIVFNAGETLTLNATKAVNILAGFDATEVFAKSIGGLFGFELPASGGGEVTIKAGKFINDATTTTVTGSTVKTKAGGVNQTETGSSMGANILDATGNLSLIGSGDVYLSAGKKMRIEAQGAPANVAGQPHQDPLWAFTQLEALVISANKNSIPLATAMRIEVDNGDFIQSVTKIGDIGIITDTGAIAIAAGAGPSGNIPVNPGDILIKSYKGMISGDSALSTTFNSQTCSQLTIGKSGKATDAVGAFSAGFGYDAVTPGVAMATAKGAASVLGSIQAGMGVGKTPSASTNFIAYNAAGMESRITGGGVINVAGGLTTTISGGNNLTITGGVASKTTGGITSDTSGAVISKVTGLVKTTSTGYDIISPSGVLIQAASNVEIKAAGTVDITGGGVVTIKGATIKLN
jgi:hypothetical protein